MTFRQHNQNPHALWRKRVRPLLVAAGLPDAVADDDRRWGYLLDHGADEFNSGWSPRDMTPRQAADLLALVEAHYGQAYGGGLLRGLRERADQGRLG
jgi:hypothetical protein